MSHQPPSPITLEEVSTVRFNLGGRSEYRVVDVDPLIDSLIARVKAGEPVDDLVARPRFRLSTRYDSSYRCREVDAFVKSLKGRPVARP
ncbi:hypothetical protein [Acidipropionibacterium jensenii]|uniref:Uncharacterized protein n=1 Tax=Acidipropionibacterium jensenii TaxID=1749 RepID=A0A3S4VJV6_9ACTN|nr:hypothetical protein [Acidipropionibacterium jensenii]AZZ41070.1 hypothetical protein C0Z11_00840 [Acidipropionibacterium jensenii]MDN5997001.1 hypothetical protein [Acidipropionibacterium jensenii]MDN6593201.1 hypothetical protein [Acidipropionibacterium jensenii]MDN6792831.1 hypothetical protein [Acidipropionibacterium jensenii]VEI03586.1 Uncharacterised protein [Acidipropionibacterium jensenii]